MRKGTRNGHDRICTCWYSYLCSINDMIEFWEGNSDARVWMVWPRYVHEWCVCVVDAIGVDRLVGGFG